MGFGLRPRTGGPAIRTAAAQRSISTEEAGIMVAEGSSVSQDGPRFALVQQLSRELSKGQLEVPGFPEIAMRVRRALKDPNCTSATIASLVSAEPMIAARLLRMANSAALRPGKVEIKDLKTAISRIGLSLVRSAAMSFAAEQMRLAHKLEAVRAELESVWQDSTAVAANAYVLARRVKKVNPDESLLAGLMHAVGKLYILSRAEQHLALLEDRHELEAVLADWYVPIGEAVLQHWDFSAEISAAISAQLDLDTPSSGEPDMRDILMVAVLLRRAHNAEAEAVEEILDSAQAGPRLGLKTGEVVQLLDESAEQISILRKTLGE
jgi:HD-like signal output (HDOD) protein